jgi:hypothetical protein
MTFDASLRLNLSTAIAYPEGLDLAANPHLQWLLALVVKSMKILEALFEDDLQYLPAPPSAPAP